MKATGGVVTAQEHLDELAGCEVIEGALVVTPRDGVRLDLRPLASLRRVEGDVWLGCEPYALLDSCEEGLSSVEGLEQLEAVGSLALSGVPLTSLAPLGNLRSVETALSITNCNELTSLEGLQNLSVRSLTLAYDERLASLGGVRLAAAADVVELRGLPALRDFSLLAALTSADRLELTELRLRNLGALRNLTDIRSLILMSMPELRDVSALAQLRQIGELNVTGTALADLDALQLAAVEESLVIADNIALTNLDGLGRLRYLGALSVISNPALTRLPAFTHVTAISQIHVQDNAALVEGPSFPALLSMSTGIIFIGENTSLQRVGGFDILQEAAQIEIRNNAQLQAVELPALQRASRLHVTCNPALPEQTLRPLLTVSSGDLLLEGNRESPGYCEP